MTDLLGTGRNLPFKFDTGYSIDDITKNFKIITNSSNKYNSFIKLYFNNNPQRSEDDYFSIGDPNFSKCTLPFSPVESRQKRNNLSIFSPEVENHISQQFQSFETHSSFLEENYRRICGNNLKYQIIRSSKVKTMISSDSSSKFLLKNDSEVKLHLPSIKNDYVKKSFDISTRELRRSKLGNFLKKSSTELIDNLFEYFYGKKWNINNKREIKYQNFKKENKFLESLILDKIQYFRDGGTNFNFFNFMSTFHHSTSNEMILKLSPMKITLNVSNSDKKQKIKIPFDLIPLFYFLDLKEAIEFLFYIVRIKNGETKDEESEKNEDLSASASDEEEFILDVKMLDNAFQKIKIFSKDYLSENNLNFNKFKSENLNFSFTWLTTKNIYTVNVTPPRIRLIYPQRKTKIIKTIDKEFLMYLFSESFDNWEFNTINYLLLIKKFRTTLFEINSKLKSICNTSFDKNIYIDEDRIQIGNDRILNEHNYIFIFTDIDGLNYLIRIAGYKAYISNLINRNQTNERFDFSLMESISIYKISFIWNIQKIMSKIFNVNRFGYLVTKDTEFLRKIDDEYISYAKKYNLFSSNVDISRLKYKFKEE